MGLYVYTDRGEVQFLPDLLEVHAIHKAHLFMTTLSEPGVHRRRNSVVFD